ncbi:diphthine--ammonia ligase [Chitinophaga alhagiae]|uniref:Dph6-related ATP pyrophosphatase n=1 Tax=Chitinophaga alhagiae TaxID=2203219 RepID=UPI0018E58968|nr:diphthine--ammonia ligase [Chitinophaga alhagiae]
MIASWSGGKDSCFALMQAIQQGHSPVALLNVLNENGRISRSHGLPEWLLQQQARAMDLPLHTVASSWEHYEQNFINALQSAAAAHAAQVVVFGDIDLQAHRTWEEKVCAAAGLKALLPLWQQERKALVYRMLQEGIRCMIVSCNSHLGESFLGRMMDDALIAELEEKGVDVCGENGEFHTMVTDCPLFAEPVSVPAFTKIKHENYWFLQMGA